MEISKVMTRDVTFVRPDTQIPEIARRMRDEEIGSMPVSEDDRLIGMVTDRDIVVRAVAEGLDVREATARDVMSPKILYCFEDATLETVLRNMGENQVRRMPVVNHDKRLVGVVSLGDLSKAAEKAAAGGALKEISETPADH